MEPVYRMNDWTVLGNSIRTSIADYTLLLLFFALSRQEIKLDIRVLDFEEDDRETSRVIRQIDWMLWVSDIFDEDKIEFCANNWGIVLI